MAVEDDDTQLQDDSARAAERRQLPSAWVHVLGPTLQGFVVQPSGTTLGREAVPPLVDVALSDPRASRRHAMISAKRGEWVIEDLGSRNGAFVDGAVLAPNTTRSLADGSVIRIGDTLALFHVEPASSDNSDFYPGVSAEANRVRARVLALARGTGHVLVIGETGTGKERVARRIGHGSPPLITVNCAELSRDLARSELFGHVRGAFSGAVGAAGLVDAAGDGCLFLDEIGELPLDVQSELLRFLEDGSYRSVGAAELKVSRARVIGATNVDLDDAVVAGTFRRDLLARLRATNPPIALSPLRERRLDVPGWLDTFVREVVSSPPHMVWSPGALECLLLYPWPENLRELRSVVRGALEEPREWPLHSSRLPARVREHRRRLREASGAVQAARAREPVTRAPTRDEIESVLAQTHGRVRETARLLGVDRRKLYRLCEKLGVEPELFRRGD
jgi:DNA-binding NtrC family response regulator